MNKPNNAQLIAAIAGHLQGYVKQMESVGQINVAQLMANEFNVIVGMLKERLPDEAPASDKG